MRWIAVAIAIFAVIEWISGYAMYYQWNLPVWLGHIAYSIMLLAAVVGIIKSKSSHRIVNRNQAVDSDVPNQE